MVVYASRRFGMILETIRDHNARSVIAVQWNGGGGGLAEETKVEESVHKQLHMITDRREL